MYMMNMQDHAPSLLLVICFLGKKIKIFATDVGFVISKNVRVTELRVPSQAVLGESVLLLCRYDLGTEDLYVVKWYKDDLEFYRFEPKDQNQSVYFPQPGIDIDLQQSGSNAVFLRNVALDSAGTYKCQVSTDAPTYSCVQAVKEMDIIIMPNTAPIISGGEDGYEFGDNVTLNCSSSKSKPAALLNWFVNGKQVPDSETVDHGITEEKENLQVTSKSLQLHIEENLFQNGKLIINCQSEFYGKVIVSGKQFTLSGKDVSTVNRYNFLYMSLPIFLTIWSVWR